MEPWTPVARPSTTVVVGQPGDPSGSSERYHLHGNFAPEAFSSDGSELLMLQYLPATHPDSYRVVRLGLDKGNVEELYGRSKLAQPMGPMSGTRLPPSLSSAHCTLPGRSSVVSSAVNSKR